MRLDCSFGRKSKPLAVDNGKWNVWRRRLRLLKRGGGGHWWCWRIVRDFGPRVIRSAFGTFEKVVGGVKWLYTGLHKAKTEKKPPPFKCWTFLLLSSIVSRGFEQKILEFRPFFSMCDGHPRAEVVGWLVGHKQVFNLAKCVAKISSSLRRPRVLPDALLLHIFRQSRHWGVTRYLLSWRWIRASSNFPTPCMLIWVES